MSAEPNLDRAALARHLRSLHGLNVDMLTFLPAGTLPAYRADGTSSRHFVKVVPNTPSGAHAAERLIHEAPLLRALQDVGDPLRVPRLLPAPTSAFLSTFGDFRVAVFEWINAVNLGSEWEDALPDLAALLGHLHAHTNDITARVSHFPVPPEDFALPFESALRRDLAILTNLPHAARPGLHALKNMVRLREAVILRALAQARELRVGLLTRPMNNVVCHTDAHGANVLKDASGYLWLVDWETARLAPAEHDLWMLLVHRPDILPAYRMAARGNVQLNADALSFYVLRRVLEDLAVDLHVMMHEHKRPEDDAETLDILARFILPALDRVELDCATVIKAAVPS